MPSFLPTTSVLLLLLLLPPAPAPASCSCSWPESQHLLASTLLPPPFSSSLFDLSPTMPKRKSTKKGEMLNEPTWFLVQAFSQKYKISIELGKTIPKGHGAVFLACGLRTCTFDLECSPKQQLKLSVYWMTWNWPYVILSKLTLQLKCGFLNLGAQVWMEFVPSLLLESALYCKARTGALLGSRCFGGELEVTLSITGPRPLHT